MSGGDEAVRGARSLLLPLLGHKLHANPPLSVSDEHHSALLITERLQPFNGDRRKFLTYWTRARDTIFPVIDFEELRGRMMQKDDA